MTDVALDPADTTHLRRMLAPVMRRNEKHTQMPPGPTMDGFLDSLIKEGIIHMLTELTAFRDGYLGTPVADDGTTPGEGPTPPSNEPGEPSSATVVYRRPENLSALAPDAFARELVLLPPDEFERLTAPVTDDVDPFDAEQRALIDKVRAGGESLDVFEIEMADHAPGESFEHEGRMVKALGFSTREGMLRVTYADPAERSGTE